MSEPFVIETAEDGVTPVRYSCQELMENNQMSFLSVEYYYDIMYDAGEDEAAVVAKAESDLLSKVAANFGIISGDRCQIPPINNLWVVEVTSRPEDEYISVFNSCQELVPGTGQACSVYRGHMEAYYSGDDDPSALENYIQQNLNTLGKNQNYEIAYLGAQLDTSLIDSNPGSDNLSPALNSAESQVQSNNNDKGKRTVTFVGGLMVAGFLAAFLGIFFMLYRRRQKFLSAQDVEIALSKSDLDDASLREQRRERDRRQQSGDDLDEPEIGEEYDNNYTFDLGSSMKHELFNIHGRATADQQKQYGIGIEETSDSDADSWAQTDGTIGSLELQLEPITAEV